MKVKVKEEQLGRTKEKAMNEIFQDYFPQLFLIKPNTGIHGQLTNAKLHLFKQKKKECILHASSPCGNRILGGVKNVNLINISSPPALDNNVFKFYKENTRGTFKSNPSTLCIQHFAFIFKDVPGGSSLRIYLYHAPGMLRFHN